MAMILPDVLEPGLDLVLCGTAPGRASARAGAYYAGPGNLFWPTLHRVGLTPVLLRPQQFPEVVRYGIGLTDLCKTEWGSDAELSREAFDVAGFAAKMEAVRPAAIAFDSKTAGKAYLGRPAVAYGRQEETLAGAVLFVLPSPSGRARSFWDIRPWEALAAFVGARRHATAASAG